MATSAEQLLIRIDATTEQLRRELKRAEDSTGAFERRTRQHLNRADRNFNQLNRTIRTATRLLAAFGVGLSVRGLQNFARNALNTADELSKLSRQIGVSAESLQAFDFAATQSGVSSNALQQSLQRLTRRVGEARQGKGELARVAAELGVNLHSTETAFRDIADAIANSTDEADAARIANAAFGRSGMELVRMLQNGTQGLDDFRTQAEQAGLILSSDLLETAERLNDRLDVLGRQLRNTFQEAFLRAVANNFDTIDATLEALTRTFTNNLSAIASVSAALGALMAVRFSQWLFTATRNAIALRGALTLLGGPAGAIVTLAAGLGTYIALTRNATSVTGDYTQAINTLTDAQRRLQQIELARDIPRQQQHIRQLQDRYERLNDSLNQIATTDPFGAQFQDLESVRLEMARLGVEVEKAESELADMQDRQNQLRNTNEATTISVRGQAVEVSNLADEFEKLRDRLEPARVAQRRLAQDFGTLNAALASGAITLEEYVRLIGLLQQSLQETEAPEVAANEMVEVFENAIERLDAAFVDMWSEFISGGGNAFDTFKRMFNQMLAELAHAAITRPIMVGITQGAIGGVGQAVGGGVVQGLAGRAGQVAGQAVFGTSAAHSTIAGVGGQQASMLAAQTGAFGQAGLSATAQAAGGSALASTVAAAAPWAAAAIAVGSFLSSRSRRKREERLNQEQFKNIQQRMMEIDAIIQQNIELDESTKQAQKATRRERELSEARTEQNRAAIETVHVMEDLAETLEKITRTNRERERLEERFFQLTNDTVALRALEIQRTEEANRSILRYIFGLEDQIAAVQQAESAAQNAFRLLQQAVQLEIEVLQDRLGGRLSLLDRAISRMAQSARSTPTALDRAQAQATLQLARAAGLESIGEDELERALDIVAQPSEGLFSSFNEYQRDFVRTQKIIDELYSQGLKTHDAEMARLHDIVATGQSQLNALFGIDDSVMSVEDAVRNLASAISGAESARSALTQMQASPPSFAPQPTPPSTMTPGLTSDPVWESILSRHYQAHVARFGVDWHTSRTSDAERAGALARMQAEYMRIKGFADGGMHTGGLRIVGERGPELEMTGPSQIMSNNDLMRALSGDRMVGEIRALRSEVASLRREQARSQYDLVKYAKRTRDTLDQWNVDGLPEERVT